MDIQQQKKMAAEAAMAHISPLIDDQVMGIGTGSTANLFIDALAAHKHRIRGVIASSSTSAKRLSDHGIKLLDLNDIVTMPVYIDGADEIDNRLHMIKGGGGALMREKIVAALAEQFICICDASKLVTRLGKFPLPIEVIPMAKAQVARALNTLGGNTIERQGFITDNGNIILDVHGLQIDNATALEEHLNNITGIVCNGLFARKPANLLVLARADGVQLISATS